MQKVALITGSGMDAKVLTHLLLSKNYHVFVSTRRNTVFDFEDYKKIFVNDLVKYPNSKLSVLYTDISDGESVENCIKAILSEIGKLDELYHLAASSHVAYSYTAPSMNIQTNGMSSFYFLESIRKYTPKTRYYFAATTEMFSGDINDQKYTESSKLHPKTPYGISKCLGFYWTQYFRETYGLFALSGILANHSCQYRHPSFFIRKLTQGAAKIACGKEQNIKFGHLNWARDEMFADFAMEAAWKLLQQEKPQDTAVGNGDTKWGEEYVQLAFDYFNLNWKKYILFDKEFLRANEVIKLEIDPKLAIETIGWKPNRMPFKDHIEIMCKWDFDLESGKNPDRVNVFELYPN